MSNAEPVTKTKSNAINDETLSPPSAIHRVLDALLPRKQKPERAGLSQENVCQLEMKTRQTAYIDARRQAQLDLPNNATADWQAVEVGQPVQRGDIFRYTLGTEIPVPHVFHGQTVRNPDFIFRKPEPASVSHTKIGGVA